MARNPLLSVNYQHFSVNSDIYASDGTVLYFTLVRYSTVLTYSHSLKGLIRRPILFSF